MTIVTSTSIRVKPLCDRWLVTGIRFPFGRRCEIWEPPGRMMDARAMK